MRDIRKVFAAVAVLFLLILAVSPLKDYMKEWRRYQVGYNKYIENLPQRVKPVDIGIRQTWVRKLDRVDRCETCHLGLNEAALQNAPQPYRTHPKIYHDVEEFGCTVCHEGQGASTEFKESTGRVKYWDRPLLQRAYMEASCGKCHKEPDVAQAPVLTLGRKLIREANCVGCHKLNGYDRQWIPNLNGIGQKVNRTWLVSWLRDPSGYLAKPRMPNFLLPADEANTLADFLLTFDRFSGNAALDSLPAQFASATADQKAKLAELGATRFREARCISCHAINGKGGYVAADLGKVASKTSAVWLYNFIKNPKRLQPGILMPRYRFTGQELLGVVAYMQSEFVDPDFEPSAAPAPEPGLYEKGKALFGKYNCGGCHELAGMNKEEERGPELSNIGGKKLYEIDFGKTTIDRTLPSYLTTKVLQPRAFSDVAKMPRFFFSKEEARAVAVALLANGADPIPDDLMVRPAPPAKFDPQGDFGKLVNDLACFGCHVMNGRGRLVATDLSREASQARREWIEGYFKVPYSLRPILPERMPNLFLPPDEIKTLADYMETNFIADSLEGSVPSDPATVTTGRGLYYERYGCQACHQIGSKGGYVGPPLDKVGGRLKPGYVVHWLKNPQALKPGTLEPNNNLTDAEAQSITAYLMSLK